ncbi:hypothetical protein [Aliivibrio fischeri]|uniref:hypothetical protein n=1 Tax=Aliivibrio fischeri TaxID=668 RepID=UPI0007C4AA26|nr:hypothetical protein [Aliivibrio fischeri]
MIKFLLQKLLGYKVVITVEKGISKGDDPIITRCWLSKSCSIHALWNGRIVSLNSDKSVSGLPLDCYAHWVTLKEYSMKNNLNKEIKTNELVANINNALKQHKEISLSVDGKGNYSIQPQNAIDLAMFNGEPMRVVLVVFHVMTKGDIPSDFKSVTNTIGYLRDGEVFRANYASADGEEFDFKMQLTKHP